MKKIFLVAIFALAAPLFADVSGHYAVDGKNPNGSKYTGTCDISHDESGHYKFHWIVGADQYDGSGTLDGDTLTVDWGAPDPVIYKVAPDGSELKGKWGPNGKGKEKLTRQ